MSNRCVHCGERHDAAATVCPSTGNPIGATLRRTTGAMLPRPPAPASRPAAPTPHPPTTGSQSSLPTTPMMRTDLIGKTVGGKYAVRLILGEGGMGTVYEAEHIGIGRAVAMKVLNAKQMKKKESIKRFHQEARAAGAIGHPNICEVYDLGTLDDGRPYLVMEKLVGETLADRIKNEGGLPVDETLDVLIQVLSGLVVAHEKGIVHRDIKPENVFLTRRVGCPPVAKLLDFGVSKMISPVAGEGEDMDLTRTGMVMGTPYYMSPEQARGDRNLDARVDMYACGVLLYETLTGQRPYVAANYNALLLKILSSRPVPATELRPTLPRGVDRVIDKAMARAREDRYQDAAEFQRDLQKLRDEAPARRSGRAKRDQDETPIMEVSSDMIYTPSSVSVPVYLAARPAGKGFDDLPTEVQHVKDFSLSDENDAPTALMKDDEIAELAKSARRNAAPPGRKAATFDVDSTAVTKTDLARKKKPFNADETSKMDSPLKRKR